MTNIILCGGYGTRLWPMSRVSTPKQFLKIFDGKSLFELTEERNKNFCENMLIVSNSEQYFLAIDQIESKNTKFLLEPVGKNTAPAITLASLSVLKDEIVLVTPSDHLIKNLKSYEKVIDEAKKLADEGYLVTFGIKPTYPETGFGYIESDGNDVKSFKEKPDENLAKSYLKSGNYYWNSGMFMFKAGVFLEEIEKLSPEIFQDSKKAFENKKIFHQNIIKIALEDMQKIKEDSIDYAVMEKSDKVKVVVADDIGWSDVGSFDALCDELDSDEAIEIDSKNNFIKSNKCVATVDCDDLIVIDEPDALLICKKGSSQKVKEVVKQLKSQNSELLKTHRKVYRPWGSYEVLLESKNYKLKRIVVNPQQRLSLQKHYHRNEHWIVVSGTATVRVGDEVKYLRPNESTYIKMGELHRLENEGKIPVVMIEAQVGEYTGEDDIVRVEDDYARE